jgi:peptidoglycan/LPS O-acetylase OafA/YrhL
MFYRRVGIDPVIHHSSPVGYRRRETLPAALNRTNIRPMHMLAGMSGPYLHQNDQSEPDNIGDNGIIRFLANRTIGGDAPRLMTNVLSGNNNISTVRVTLALMVLWSHSFAFYFDDEKREPISILLRGLYNAGNVGVACFLIMSGALVLRSWETSRNFKSFVIKRAKRLYPAYIVAVFVGAFVIAPFYANIDPIDLLRTGFLKWLFANLVFRGYAPVDNVFVHSPITIINGSLWSIGYEVICYVALVMAAALLRTRLVIGCWFAMLILITAKVFADLTGWNPGFGFIGAILGWPYLWFSVAGWFVTGMLFYLHRDAIPRHPMLLVAICLCFAGMVWMPGTTITARILMDIFYIPMLGYILFYLCSLPRLSIEGMARSHDLSYGMYLYAFPIQQIILAEWDHTLPFPAYVGLSVVSTLLISLASWTWIEKRFVSPKPVDTKSGRIQGTS